MVALVREYAYQYIVCTTHINVLFTINYTNLYSKYFVVPFDLMVHDHDFHNKYKYILIVYFKSSQNLFDSLRST